MSKKNKRKQNGMTEENKNPEVETQAAEAEMNEPEAPEAEPKAETDPAYEEMTLTAEEVKALKEKLDKLQEDKEDAIRQAQRLQAEFENYRKRNASISAESRDDGVRDAVKQMLPVLDNLERALQSAPEDPFAQGVRNIAKQFTDALAKVGAEEITAEGEFDPAVHEAVMKDSVEGVKSGHITGVLQKGYKVKGKIVRYAMVKVNE
ncbi:MAG: nucleotide exchange factor GrpE [Clostridia bacterium]|jgi:molecular chaperone GrpE|nr:nucleotide exchange factor GrpE [Clostridia bacterium]MBQ4446841.1 nucleotide exchange factor GrpE [Clostridia bacterium]MBR3487579.1 nucleotide exchange factor GrpE [Clostridia bacterium]